MHRISNTPELTSSCRRLSVRRSQDRGVGYSTGGQEGNTDWMWRGKGCPSPEKRNRSERGTLSASPEGASGVTETNPSLWRLEPRDDDANQSNGSSVFHKQPDLWGYSKISSIFNKEPYLCGYIKGRAIFNRELYWCGYSFIFNRELYFCGYSFIFNRELYLCGYSFIFNRELYFCGYIRGSFIFNMELYLCSYTPGSSILTENYASGAL